MEENNTEPQNMDRPSEADLELQAIEKYAKSNPNNLPPQFNGDADKFIDSYKELRKTLTKSQQELAALKKGTPNEPRVEPQATQVGETPVPSTFIPKNEPTPEPSPKEWEELGNELRIKGDLTPETRANLLKKYNIPAFVIDQYINGLRAQAAAAAQEAANMVGGNEKLRKMIQWASTNLSDEERNEINKQLQTPAWKTTILGLKTRMDMSNPDPTADEPKRNLPSTVSNVAVSDIEPFANKQDMMLHIRDRRYGKDQKYTDYVQERIRLSGGGRGMQ